MNVDAVRFLTIILVITWICVVLHDLCKNKPQLIAWTAEYLIVSDSLQIKQLWASAWWQYSPATSYFCFSFSVPDICKYHQQWNVYMRVPRSSADSDLFTIMCNGQRPVCHSFFFFEMWLPVSFLQWTSQEKLMSKIFMSQITALHLCIPLHSSNDKQADVYSHRQCLK